MYAEERQQAMVRLIGQQGRQSVADLATSFEVTTETVRRDLSSLERIGLVRRVHGGAGPASSLAIIETGLRERDQANIEAKEAIAEAALDQLSPPGSTVIIDAGSTTARLAAALPRDHRLSVVTHSVPVAARLAGLPHIELHLSEFGGHCGFVGPRAGEDDGYWAENQIVSFVERQHRTKAELRTQKSELRSEQLLSSEF